MTTTEANRKELVTRDAAEGRTTGRKEHRSFPICVDFAGYGSILRLGQCASSLESVAPGRILPRRIER